MKLAILSRNSSLYSTRRLVEAAREQGHTVRVLDPLRCYMRIACDGFDMHYKGKPLTGYDAVIPRIGASVTRYGTAVLRQFEHMGTCTPNPSDAIVKARDKLRAHQLLAAQGIHMPVTVFGDNPDDTADLLNLLGPAPHVIKLTESSQGAGVILTEKLSASKGVTEALRGLYANFLVQEFIAEAKGADLRCFVVGDRVIAAMRRQAPAGEFRSNLHRGGSAMGVEASAAECEVAVRATQVLGLGVAGVDLIRSDRGPLVLEVNASPGLEGIEKASEKDVAGEIVRFVAQGCLPRAKPARGGGRGAGVEASKPAAKPTAAAGSTTSARRAAVGKAAGTAGSTARARPAKAAKAPTGGKTATDREPGRSGPSRAAAANTRSRRK